MVSEGKNRNKSRKTCERLPLTDAMKRRLWGESGGYCLNPACATSLFDEDTNVDFAEMAHIVAASSGGPRDVDILQLSADERAHHSNVVLLCANCHTKVDKAPDNYPTDLLKQWKDRHDETLQLVFGTPEFSSREDGHDFVAPLLEENRSIFDQYGPTPGDFSEARASQWRRHAIATIVPNNAAIARALKQNRSLLGAKERHIADLFAIHAREFSERHLLKNFTAGSTQFPDNMDTIFKGDPA